MSRRGSTSVFSRIAVVAVALLVGSLVASVRPADAALLGPTLNSVSPNRAVPGVNNQKLKLLGDFTSGSATVAFAPATGITMVGSPTTVNTGEIDVTVNVATDAPHSARDVTVTQGVLGSSSTCVKCVTVGPDITSVGGPLSNQGPDGTFTITGHAFKTGSTVKIERKSYGFGGTESDSFNATSAVVGAPQAGNVTTITATVPTLNRAPGHWQVDVIEAVADGGTITTFGDGSTTGLELSGQQPTLTHLSTTRINSNQSNLAIDVTGDNFAQGMTVAVSGTGITQTAKTAVADRTHAKITLSGSANLATGPRTLILRNADNQKSENTDAICADCDLPTPPNPAITSVTPASIGEGATAVQFVVVGTNFGSLPVATLSPNDTDASKKISATATRDSATQITLSVSTGTATPAGKRALTLTFNGDTTATKADAIDVISGFDVFNVSPPGRPRGYDGTFQINGSGFVGSPKPTVEITPNTGITRGTVTVDSPSRLTVEVTVANDAATTPRDVTVTQGSTTKTCTGCFTVGLLPTVTAISPTSGSGGGTVAINAITGTNFAPNPTVALERTGQTKVPMTAVKRDSTTQISGTFDLADAAPGVWDVVVTNADGGSGSKAAAFTVVFPAPTVSSSNPDNVAQAAKAVKLTVAGTFFATGMTVTIPNPGGVTVDSVTRKSTTSAEVVISATDNAALGSRDLKVTNSDGQSGTCTSCFVVTQGAQPKTFGPGTTAYENFNGGAFVAAGNIDAQPLNGTEFVTAANAGGGPHVRPYRINPVNGNVQPIGDGFFAYTPQFTGGVHVAVGNVDGNAANGDEIVTGAGPGGGPHVRVFHLNNDLTVGEPVGPGFFAYDPGFPGGVWVATGDVNGDGKDDIITGAGAGGGPHVRVWTLAGDGHSFTEIGGWMAYSQAFAGGVVVAAGNMVPEAGDKQLDEVVTVPASGGGPHTRITNAAGKVLNEFMAFNSADANGYRVTAGDFDFDTVADVAVSRGSSSDIHLAQITPSGQVALITPDPTPFGNLPCGTNIAAADIDADGDSDLVLSPDHANPVTIRLIRPLSP